MRDFIFKHRADIEEIAVLFATFWLIGRLERPDDD
jgi:hypothetical protein